MSNVNDLMYDVTKCLTSPSPHPCVHTDSIFLLTWLQCWPFLASNPDILEWNVAVRQQESQWLSKSLHVEVEHFVFRHFQSTFFWNLSGKIFFIRKLRPGQLHTCTWSIFIHKTFSSTLPILHTFEVLLRNN